MVQELQVEQQNRFPEQLNVNMKFVTAQYEAVSPNYSLTVSDIYVIHCIRLPMYRFDSFWQLKSVSGPTKL